MSRWARRRTWTRGWMARSSPARPPLPLRSARLCMRPPPWLGSRYCNESRLALNSLQSSGEARSFILAAPAVLKHDSMHRCFAFWTSPSRQLWRLLGTLQMRLGPPRQMSRAQLLSSTSVAAHVMPAFKKSMKASMRCARAFYPWSTVVNCDRTCRHAAPAAGQGNSSQHCALRRGL